MRALFWRGADVNGVCATALAAFREQARRDHAALRALFLPHCQPARRGAVDDDGEGEEDHGGEGKGEEEKDEEEGLSLDTFARLLRRCRVGTGAARGPVGAGPVLAMFRQLSVGAGMHAGADADAAAALLLEHQVYRA